jgi:hypothetical protein
MMNKKLQITLYVVTVYLAIFGILFLFAPRVAEQVMQTSLPDTTLNLLYGQLTLTFAYVAFMAARKADAGDSWRTILILNVGHVIVFGYLLLTGMQGFAQVGPPLIMNAVFALLLYLFRK